jgi:hypothetical protein
MHVSSLLFVELLAVLKEQPIARGVLWRDPSDLILLLFDRRYDVEVRPIRIEVTPIRITRYELYEIRATLFKKREESIKEPRL